MSPLYFQRTQSTNTALETIKTTQYSTFSFQISHMGFSCVHTGALFLTPNIEISTCVWKYKLHNEFSDSGPVATYTGVDFACVYMSPPIQPTCTLLHFFEVSTSP